MATVAVVIPVYATPENHRLDFLGQTLRSVQRQTYRDLVAVVVDDGSPADVAGFVQAQHMGNVRYVRRARSPADLRTASNALNFGINLCLEKDAGVFTRHEAGDFGAIAYLHSDDLLTAESVQERLAALNQGAAFVYSDMIYIDTSNVPTGVNRWKGKCGSNTLFGFPHHTVMWSIVFAQLLRAHVAEKYEQNGIFDSRLSYGEDRDVSISSVEAAMTEGKAVHYLPEITYAYRQHALSISGDHAGEDYIRRQRELIDTKHFSPQEMKRLRLQRILARATRATSDLPWSLGYSLPESVKQHLRPIKDFVKREKVVTAAQLSPDEMRSLEKLLVMLPSR